MGSECTWASFLPTGLGCCSRSTRNSKMVSSPVVTKMQAIMQKEMVREFLAEFMSTYVMMVSGWVAQGGWALRKGREPQDLRRVRFSGGNPCPPPHH